MRLGRPEVGSSGHAAQRLASSGDVRAGIAEQDPPVPSELKIVLWRRGYTFGAEGSNYGAVAPGDIISFLRGAGDEAKIINDEGLIMMVISMQRMYQQGN